jgi:hypothetical protein
MFRITVIVLAVLCRGSISGAAAEQTAKPLPSIQVTAPQDVANVEALHDALTTLSEKVTACVKAGRKAEICQCSYPQDLAKLRKGYADLIQQHPGWKDQLLSYHRLSNEGRNISGTLVLENLRRQLEVLKCE